MIQSLSQAHTDHEQQIRHSKVLAQPQLRPLLHQEGLRCLWTLKPGPIFLAVSISR